MSMTLVRGVNEERPDVARNDITHGERYNGATHLDYPTASRLFDGGDVVLFGDGS